MLLGQSKKRVPIEEINSKIPKDSFLKAIKHLGVEPIQGVRRAATLFSCKCGKSVSWYYLYVVQGFKKSCGCLVGGGYRRNAKYTYSSEKVRKTYYTMINRCYNKNDTAYKWYGKRGVRVCKEWKDNPQSFFDWVEKSGYKQNLSLDKDIKGDGMLYSPETCCWVTHKENCNHRRRNGAQKIFKK